MMARLHLPAHEIGHIRVFAVNRPIPEMTRTLRQHGIPTIASDLLNHAVTDKGVELFALSDLEELGLAGYLSEGYNIDPQQLSADRGKLTGLDGYVLLLFSEAFSGQEVTLTPGSDLTLIATYTEPQPALTGPAPESAAAQPYTGVPAAAAPSTPAKRGSAFVAVAVMAIVALVLWLILR